jgi:hypothetical protein
MSVSLCPTFGIGWQGFTSSGIPLNAGLINTYAAGGTTPQATYTSSTGGTPCANPIVLAADGRPTTEIWLTDGLAYRFDLTDSLANLIKTYDNINTSTLSSNLVFTRNETGAVTRTVKDKLLEIMTAADFSSAGNYAAAQAALLYNQFAATPAGSCGNLTATGNELTGLGFEALSLVTTSIGSTAVGAEALFQLTSGNYNSAFGLSALRLCTTGYLNTAVGISAGTNTTSGYGNSYFGSTAGKGNTTGQSNTVVGLNAALNVATGSVNSVIGVEALTGNVARDWCLFNTFAAGLPNWVLGAGWTDGGGSAAKSADGTGTLTRVGDDAPANVMVGLAFTVTFTVLNYSVGSVTCTVGGLTSGAISANGVVTFSGTTTTTAPLTFTPTNTSRFNINTVTMFMTTPVSASSNVALGSQSMWYQVTGGYNVAVGQFALHLNAVGSRNIALGAYAGFYESLSDKFFVNNRDQTTEALDRSNSLLYGVMDALVDNQSLAINAGLVQVGTRSVGIGIAANSLRALFLGGPINGGTTSYGADIAAVFGSGVTTLGIAEHVGIVTKAAAYTMTNGYGLQIDSPILGAGSAITNAYGLKIENQAAAGTLNYSIYTGTGRVHFGGIPTSNAGLVTGDIWANSNVLTIIP